MTPDNPLYDEPAALTPLDEAILDAEVYLEDQPAKADEWTVGGVSTPYIGSLRIIVNELKRLRAPSSLPPAPTSEPWKGVWNNWIAPFHACPRCGASLNWEQGTDYIDEPIIRASCCGIGFGAGMAWRPATAESLPVSAPPAPPSVSSEKLAHRIAARAVQTLADSEPTDDTIEAQERLAGTPQESMFCVDGPTLERVIATTISNSIFDGEINAGGYTDQSIDTVRALYAKDGVARDQLRGQRTPAPESVGLGELLDAHREKAQRLLGHSTVYIVHDIATRRKEYEDVRAGIEALFAEKEAEIDWLRADAVSSHRAYQHSMDLLQSQLAEKEARNATLTEWQQSVLNALESKPAFVQGKWAGDKRGWGYVFEYINWIHRSLAEKEAQALTAEELLHVHRNWRLPVALCQMCRDIVAKLDAWALSNKEADK